MKKAHVLDIALSRVNYTVYKCFKAPVNIYPYLIWGKSVANNQNNPPLTLFSKANAIITIIIIFMIILTEFL